MECIEHRIHRLLLTVSVRLANAWKNSYQTPCGVRRGTREQLSSINRFWRLYLGALPVDTLEVRTYLTDDMTINQWLTQFTQYVLPFIQRHECMLLIPRI